VQEVAVAGPGFWQQRLPAGPALAALYRTGAVYVQRRAGAPAADAPAPEAAGADAPDAHAAEPDALPQARKAGSQGPVLSRTLQDAAAPGVSAAGGPARSRAALGVPGQRRGGRL